MCNLGQRIQVLFKIWDRKSILKEEEKIISQRVKNIAWWHPNTFKTSEASETISEVPWPGGQTGQCVQHVRTFLGPRLRVQCWLLAWLSPPHSAIRCSRCDSIAKTSTGGQPTPTCSKVSWERMLLGLEPAAVLLVSNLQQSAQSQPHVVAETLLIASLQIQTVLFGRYKEWQNKTLNHCLVSAPELRKHHPAAQMDEVSLSLAAPNYPTPTRPAILHLVFQNL